MVRPLTTTRLAQSATWPTCTVGQRGRVGRRGDPQGARPKGHHGRPRHQGLHPGENRAPPDTAAGYGRLSGRRSRPGVAALTLPTAAARRCSRTCRRAGLRLQQGVAGGPRLVGGTAMSRKMPGRTRHVAVLSLRLDYVSHFDTGRDARRAGLLPARVHRGGEEVMLSLFPLSPLYICTRTNTRYMFWCTT